MQEIPDIIEVVQGCIHAKRESQQAFYRSYYGFAMRICMRYCNTEDDAMEVINDGFVKIYRELGAFSPRYDHYEASLKGWMKSIFVHTAIDHFRKQHRTFFTTEINDNALTLSASEVSAIDQLSYKEIIELVQRLSPVYRAVFNLFVIDGFKHEDIAEQLNISVGTSKSNLSKARANIQKMLKEISNKYHEQRAV